MSPDQLVENSLKLLGRFLDEACKEALEDDLHGAFVYRHARNVFDLGDDVFALEKMGRTSAARIIIRPMIESLFRIAAAIKYPAFAAEKLVAELEDEVGRIEKWVKADQSGEFEKSMASAMKELSDYAAKLRIEHSVTTSKQWNVYETARLADLSVHYAREYFLYSKYVHCTISGIISQESQVGQRLIVQNLIYIVLAATALAAQGVQTKNPQGYVDEATSLLEEGLRLCELGVFSEKEG